jgi:hypothetical protein
MTSKINRKAQMQMSVGTIVTIVLLMTVLILGLTLTRTIFTSSVENIDAIDDSIKKEINELFDDDNKRTVIVYPTTRSISIGKGSQGGFGFSIRNLGRENRDSLSELYSYKVEFDDSSCGITEGSAQNLIILGGAGNDIEIASGKTLTNPVLVKFDIGESAPLCNIRYNLFVKYQDNLQIVETISVDLEIKPE